MNAITKVIRTFHPVGHGAFYTEEFETEDFFMIYDCGTHGKIKGLEAIIKKEIKGEFIDLLVISHFHKDHISGVEYLLQNYKVKTILLPLLEPIEKIKVFLQNVDKGASSFIKNLCLDPEATIKNISLFEDIKIVNVSSEVADDAPVDINDISSRTVKSGTKVIFTFKNQLEWIYLPFNFDSNKRSSELLKEFTSRNIPLDTDNFINFYTKNKTKVRAAYDAIEDDLNTNSLVLYSDICKNEYFQKAIGYYSRNSLAEKFSMKHISVGCLYLGDYNAKGSKKLQELKEKYREYQRYISIIQIPHHGSIENYHENLNFKDNLISIISAPRNSYNHPNAEVLKQIVQKKGFSIIVTDDESSKFVQKISVYKR